MGANPAARAPRRLAALGAVGIVLAVAGAVSATASTRPTGAAVRPDGLVAMPPAASAFFCAALEHVAGVVDSTVAIADLTAAPRVAEVTVSDQSHHVTTRTVDLAPGGVARLHPGSMLPGAVEAVSVVSERGGLAVTEAVRGDAGTAVAPCVSTTATSWWFTGGSTEPGATFLVELYNPTPSRAVATVRLTTPQGPLPPPAYGGLVLGPYQVLPLVVHAVAPNESPITVHVTSTDGAVVAEGIERGIRGSSSIALLAGTPSAQRLWVVPIASSRWPLRTTLELFTTSLDLGATATVRVLPVPSGCASSCPGPLAVAVPADGAVADVQVPTTSVPIGEPFALVVHASRPGVVVTEEVGAEGATGAGVPVADPDLEDANRLVLLDPLGGGFSQVGVVNPSSSTVTVRLATVSATGTRSPGRTLRVAPGARTVLGAAGLGLDDGVLELDATGPIVASGLVAAASPGAGTLAAEPAAS